MCVQITQENELYNNDLCIFFFGDFTIHVINYLKPLILFRFIGGLELTPADTGQGTNLGKSPVHQRAEV